MEIAFNAVYCQKCNQLIVSENRHDFKFCQCKNIAVDGGQEYLRRAGPALEDNSYQEASAFMPDGKEKTGECAGKYLIWSSGGKTNPSMIFSRKEEAILTANNMKKKFGGNWYISGPLETI